MHAIITLMATHKGNTIPAALGGLLFALPFVFTNFIVALRIEPLYSLFRSLPLLHDAPYFPLALLLLFPIGAYVAIRPAMHKATRQKNMLYIANILTSVLLLAAFFVLFYALAEELYRCNVLHIPNCD